MRGLKALCFYGEHRKSHLRGIESRPKSVAVALVKTFPGEGSFRRRKNTHGREPAKARPPELLASRERDETLRRSPVLFPVLLVDRPHAAQVERKGGIPVIQALGFRDARVVRCKVAVRRGAFEGNNL